MTIKQFEDKNLAHYSYAVLSLGEIVLIDPSRNPEPYIEFAREHKAKIKAIIETHPHADFVSGHLEISKKTNAKIYVSKLVGASYPHVSFDDGDSLEIGAVQLQAINTPGHSPDSISILTLDENGKQHALFTGDTLFIGDCGRPDLREEAGAINTDRTVLAKNMYHSLRNKLSPLEDHVLIYPAHGAGSLCGKGLSTASSSTLGAEKISNWSLQTMSEEKFVDELLADQPFVPKYFPFNVALNKKGAEDFSTSVSKVPVGEPLNCETCSYKLNPAITIIDTRPQALFKKTHLKYAINLMDDTKFETWLGSIVNPNEKFYLLAEDENSLRTLLERIAKIGYESQIESAFVTTYGNSSAAVFNVEKLRENPESFTIVDIRNESELKKGKFFRHAIHIPLHQLRERAKELPTEKPILVHCAGGYRSAAGSTILKSTLKNTTEVHDLSESVKEFSN